jgi:hypothetical protein
MTFLPTGATSTSCLDTRYASFSLLTASARSHSIDSPLPAIRFSAATVLPFPRRDKPGAYPLRLQMGLSPLSLSSCFGAYVPLLQGYGICGVTRHAMLTAPPLPSVRSGYLRTFAALFSA